MRRHLALGCVYLVCAVDLRAADSLKLTVAFDNDTSGKVVRIAVSGLDDATLAACAKRKSDPETWEAAARVKLPAANEDDARQLPALLGRWFVKDKTLLFEPRFPYSAGTAYRLTLDPARLLDPAAKESKPLSFDLQMPKKDLTPVTKIVNVYPTRKVLPENQLRFYIHFSQPMNRGEAYEHIKLLNGNGKPIDDVFLELGEELWDPSMKRFTLLFHPGRVKSGLRPREELGPILENGKNYTLVISGGWHDAEGRLLVDKEFRKDFKAGPAADEPVDPKKWKLKPPSALTKDAFLVRFPESLDHALLNRVVWIVDGKNQKVDGKINVAEEEKLWSFTPEKPWTEGKYRLVAETILEDLAANRIGRKFEVDMLRPVDKQGVTEIVELPFEVKAASDAK